MRRAAGALGALILVIALVSAAPSLSGAAPSGSASAKHRCKHKAKHHRKHRKRCRKKGKSTTPTGDKPGKGGDQSPAGPPGRLLATERELSSTDLQLQLSRASVAAGTTIVEQHNAGSDPHNLILERQGAVAFSFPTLDPGGDQRQTVNLAHGTWTLYCSLLNHKDLGMQATLTVN